MTNLSHAHISSRAQTKNSKANACLEAVEQVKSQFKHEFATPLVKAHTGGRGVVEGGVDVKTGVVGRRGGDLACHKSPLPQQSGPPPNRTPPPQPRGRQPPLTASILSAPFLQTPMTQSNQCLIAIDIATRGGGSACSRQGTPIPKGFWARQLSLVCRQLWSTSLIGICSMGSGFVELGFIPKP